MAQKHTYSLEYFPIPKGRAERVRLTFAAAGVKWDNVGSTQFGEYKQAGNVLPWGHFPLLKVDGGQEKGGQNLSNSVALQWFIAAEEAPHLIPKAPLDQHLALSTAMTTEDRFVTYVKFAFAPAEAKEGIKKEATEQTAKHLADLSRQLGQKEFFGTTFSFADLTVWDWIDQTDQAFGTKKELERHANLRAWHERVQQQKGIAEYLKARGN